MSKKIVSLLLAIIICISICPLSIFAAEIETGASIDVKSVTALAGSAVTVNIDIKNNPGIAGAKIYVDYDPKLTLTEATAGETFAALDYMAPQALTSGCAFNWDSLDQEVTEDGTLIALTFTVSESAAADEQLEVKVSYDDGDIYDKQLDSLTLAVNNGAVTVISYMLGDVNGDQKINGKDVTLLRRYNAGYNVTINALAADVNKDGKINGKDVTLIRRINAGYDVVATCTHTPVTDEAVAPTYDSTGLTEGSHCGTCGEVLVAQQVIPKLETSYHSITYRNLQGAESPEITQYAEHLGIAFEDVPEPVRSGYEFIGWFESSEESSKKVDEVKAGRTDDITVYAHWKPITYTITYVDALVNNNPKTYTVEDEFVLADAGWSGRIFEFWADEAGAAISKISKGTTGNLTITAKWSSHKNRVVKKEDSKLLSMYDAESNKYYFVRELGKICNVVLDEIEETHNKTTDAPYTLTITESVSVSEGISNGIAEMVATSTTSSEEWQNVHTQTDTWNVKVSAGIETKMLKKLFKVNASVEVSGGTTTTDSETHVKYESETNESSVETTSTLSYAKEMTATGETSINILSDMPYGKYTYVHAADVHVFAVVTYDAQEGCYYLDTYSEMDTPHNMLMYYATAYEEDVSCQALAYDIPIDEITGIIGSSYYVKYDANGGEGEMLCSMHKVGESSALQANQYTRPGYIFAGWGLKTDSEAAVYKDGANVKDIAEQGKSVTLYAIWEGKEFTISYDANGGSGTMDNAITTYGSQYALDENKFTKTENLSLPASAASYEDWPYLFLGWSTDPNAVSPEYKPGSSICPNDVIKDHPQNEDGITLYAIWARTYMRWYESYKDLKYGTFLNMNTSDTYSLMSPGAGDTQVNIDGIKEAAQNKKVEVLLVLEMTNKENFLTSLYNELTISVSACGHTLLPGDGHDSVGRAIADTLYYYYNTGVWYTLWFEGTVDTWLNNDVKITMSSEDGHFVIEDYSICVFFS